MTTHRQPQSEAAFRNPPIGGRPEDIDGGQSDTQSPIDRRTYLESLATLASTAALAGCSLFDRGEDTQTTELDDDRARDLAEQFAPTLYFDEHERWFPTDPRPYITEDSGKTVVDGFDALEGYATRAQNPEDPPDPTVFYHAVQYEDSPLAVVQYWYYSAFDQFTTNFHWHDWEVLHVFIDTETGNPTLYVASSHSGRVPNNEFLDPDPDRAPRILSELGSHSSALSLNDIADRFQRLPIGGEFADITNSAIESVDIISGIRLAYGLPRDEGFRLPYLVPALDGAPLYEHERLPAVERADLITPDLTVHSFDDLVSPPSDLPGRSTGLVFHHENSAGDADIEYDLVPTTEVEQVDDFSGPQLGFEFDVPEFGEDAIAHHITTTGVPWQQPRYTNPAMDISDPNHRQALADRYAAIGDAAPINTIVASVTQAVTADDAPDDEGLTTEDLSVESIALLESEPEAIPTFGGVVAAQDVPDGDHRLVVNGPGVEPHSETVPVAANDTGPTTAGVGGEIPLVARENATKLEVDTEGTDVDLTEIVVADDFAGQLYKSPLAGRDAVYLHRGGAYTTEVRDTDDEIGAFRVNPGSQARVRIDEPRTGKRSLATYVADVAAETSAAVAAIDDTGETGSGGAGTDDQGADQANTVSALAQALGAVAEAARQAADRARAGDRAGSNQRLATVQSRLDRVSSKLAEARGEVPDDLERAIDRRLDQMVTRSEQARSAGKL